MKTFRIYLGLLLLLVGGISCKDNFSVDLSNQHFVRLNKTSVSITAGEKYTIKANVDTLGSANKTFNWSILNPDIASIEATDKGSAIITGLSEGSTVIKIESTDGEIKYFSDLTVAKDRIIKILAIGNSFSEDAVENYLYDLAKASGYKVLIGNLFYGGRSLQTHWERASSDGNDYQLRVISPDGSRNTFNDVSIRQTVEGENWDYISFQEVSQLSGKIEGYQEFLPKLVDYARNLSTNPEVKFILHQTWAYAEDSNHDGFNNYGRDQMTMYNAIVDAVGKAKNLAKIDMIIPSGTAIQNGRTTYLGDREYLGDLFTRDGYHLSFERGRFTAACTWYESIFKKNVEQNPFTLDALSTYENNLIKSAAHSSVTTMNKVTPLTQYRYPESNEYVLTNPIFIDFGPIFSPAPFNNYGRPTDPKLTDLKNQNGESTYFGVEVKKPFSGTLERGLGNDLGFPFTASEDMFFSDGNKPEFAVSSLAFSNLNRNIKYTFVFFGAINDRQTETEFRVIGKNEGVAYLVNDDNRDKVAIITGISPTNYGTLILNLTKGPNNRHWAGFYGVNAMIITPDGYKLPGM